MQGNVKVIFNKAKDRVFIQGEAYIAHAIKKHSCECCMIANKWGSCTVGGPMMQHCIETAAEMKSPVVWRETSVGKPVGDILAEDFMSDIDKVVDGFTQQMLDDFIRRMREGIDHLEQHETCLDYVDPTIPF